MRKLSVLLAILVSVAAPAYADGSCWDVGFIHICTGPVGYLNQQLQQRTKDSIPSVQDPIGSIIWPLDDFVDERPDKAPSEVEMFHNIYVEDKK